MWLFISSIASCAAATEVGPVLSRYVPDRSVSTPSLMTGLDWARGRIRGNEDKAVALPSRPRREIDIWTFSRIRRTTRIARVLPEGGRFAQGLMPIRAGLSHLAED